MRRVATYPHQERRTSVDAAAPGPGDGIWGFHSVDGLPDLEAASPVRRDLVAAHALHLLSNGQQAPGLDDRVTDSLARIERCAREVEAARGGGARPERAHEMSVYEIAVCEALVAWRDAAVRLRRLLDDELAQFESTVVSVRAGLTLEFLTPAIGGVTRRDTSEVTDEFESSRHRFRLALVAVALDAGMSAVEVGNAFSFSRQLASRYVKEAREKWPELATTGAGGRRHDPPFRSRPEPQLA